MKINFNETLSSGIKETNTSKIQKAAMENQQETLFDGTVSKEDSNGLFEKNSAQSISDQSLMKMFDLAYLDEAISKKETADFKKTNNKDNIASQTADLKKAQEDNIYKETADLKKTNNKDNIKKAEGEKRYPDHGPSIM